jgi:hypothetical protein
LFFHVDSEYDLIFQIRCTFWLTEPKLAWVFFGPRWYVHLFYL